MRSPVSTPGGTFTSSVLSRRALPAPRQDLQASLTSVPLPRHYGPVCCSTKKPSCPRTFPEPCTVLPLGGFFPSAVPSPLMLLHSSQVGVRIFSYVTFTPRSRV